MRASVGELIRLIRVDAPVGTSRGDAGESHVDRLNAAHRASARGGRVTVPLRAILRHFTISVDARNRSLNPIAVILLIPSLFFAAWRRQWRTPCL